MAESSEGRDIYVNHGKNLRAAQDDPYVIHGKNLIAEVDVTAHSHLVRFFTDEGLSVSSEHVEHVDTIRVRISGHPETVNDSVSRFLEQNPEATLRILEAVDDGDPDNAGADGEAGDRHSS